MHHDVDTRPQWATAADGQAPDTRPDELSALGDHLQACRGARGRWFALRSAAEAMHGFAATRLISTLVLASALIGALVALY